MTVKLTFANGAAMPDPRRPFDASPAGNACGTIEIREGNRVDAEAFGHLVRAAAVFSRASTRAKRTG